MLLVLSDTGNMCYSDSWHLCIFYHGTPFDQYRMDWSPTCILMILPMIQIQRMPVKSFYASKYTFVVLVASNLPALHLKQALLYTVVGSCSVQYSSALTLYIHVSWRFIILIHLSIMPNSKQLIVWSWKHDILQATIDIPYSSK